MTAATHDARHTAKPAVGFIGLGDQGLPMAVVLADAGYPLHVWARAPGSLDVLGAVPDIRADLASRSVLRSRFRAKHLV